MNTTNNKIAVIGMACRYPGANNVDEFWNNLLEGKDTITRFSDEELSKFEFRFEELKNDPGFVRARGILDNIDKFDAEFFGITPRDAARTDPQHRIWLETAWEAFENAGCDPVNYPGIVSVFTGGTSNTYLLNNILRDPARLENYIRLRRSDSFQLFTDNDVSFIPTKTAYHFNLRGAAINVQTTCSTSLVAISEACQSLINHQSDVSLAGAICILVPQETGYIYQEGSIHSPEGIVRPFDAEAKGTVFSNGVGAVILKRLDDAIRDHDRIYAIVSGWATNNDGSNKLSYTAPSIDGQAEVVIKALSSAGINPEEISYIESHGTGTLLGDPIELSGLKRAFEAKTSKKQFCGIGSVKSNIGHTDVAAGVASFIKACLVAYNKVIPPTINFSTPNPHIDFENSPFYFQKQLKEWKEDRPLIMGVSSFGIGGTNAHVIIEEAPGRKDDDNLTSAWPSLVLLSAKSEGALERRREDLIDYLESNRDVNIHDVAFTLETGRNHMLHRSFIVSGDINELISDGTNFTAGRTDGLISDFAFMFPGQGAQYISMGKDLYYSNRLFRETLDECFETVRSETGEDLRKLLFETSDSEAADKKLAETRLTQPALFIIEYGIAKLLEQFDIRPKYLIGHSIGEYTAACLAGVFDLNTALKVVIKRGQLMQRMQPGKMMAVRTGLENLKKLENSDFEIAADNAPSFCTISFKTENAEKVKSLLEKNGIQYIPLNTSHAFHSASFDPILSEFAEYVDQFRLNTPSLPFISCLTGSFITDDQATSGSYWAQQLRNPVLFRQGVSTISSHEDIIFLEVGPNTHLSSLVRQNKDVENKRSIIATLGKRENGNEQYRILTALGNIFLIGVKINFGLLYHESDPYKISLPSYPFERKRHWMDFELQNIPETQLHKNGYPKINEQSLVHVTEPGSADPVGGTFEREKSRIREIWKSMMDLQEINYDDDFFELGGHSLLAIQILTRIKEELNQNISLKTFLGNSTINKLVSTLTKADGPTGKKNDPVQIPDIKNLPLSLNQKRIWIISRLYGLNPAYNIPFTYKFTGELDVDVFTRAINVLFDRHFIMYSVFKQKDGVPYCEIIPNHPVVEFIDYSHEPADSIRDRVNSFAGDDSRKLFDIENGPLYRLYLLKEDNGTFYFHTTINHLIFDGWSWSVFIAELQIIYDSLLIGKEPALEDVKTHYLDYTRDLVNNEVRYNEEADSKFWVENLKGSNPVLNFPYDYGRKKTVSGFGEKEDIVISAGSTARLKEISRKEHATLFSTFLSFLGILLQKYSGENDICIGTHVANRPLSGLEKIFGMFVNTIPVRLKIEKTNNLSGFIDYTKSALLDAIAHQELPFEKIVEVVNPQRHSNLNPIFQVSLVWLFNSARPIRLANATGEPINVRKGVSPFDITFYMWEDGNQIKGEIEYNIDILNRDTIIRLRENFVHLIESAAENPDQPLSDLSIVSDSDKKRLSEFNKTETALPGLLAHNFFEEQSKLNSSKTAVISGNRSLTYKELDNRANQFARYLISLDVRSGETIGLCIERSVDMLTSILGILKAGCSYLPMDPSFPDDRLQYMFEDSSAKVIVSQESLREKFTRFTNARLVYIDTCTEEIEKNRTDKPDIMQNSQQPIYTIYTSGSTGKPKGVKVHHEAVVNLIESMSAVPGLNENDILLAVVTLSFDMSVFELFIPLSRGATIVLATAAETINGPAIIRLIEKYNITIIQATPSFWNILLSSGWSGKSDLKALCGGEMLTSNLVRKILPKVAEFWNCYGPTETTVYSTCTRIKDPDAPIHIGKPINNTSIHILDRNNRLLPLGVIGEVAIGGKGVTRGYVNKSELTAEKFIELEKGLVAYKTGDFGRILTDGNIELFGRIDNQIKLRGFRIEPGEVESLLVKMPSVKEAVVKIHRFEENDDRLVAYLNVDKGYVSAKEDVTRYLSQNLPVYMIPSFYQVSEGFPRLPNGKINKNALVLNIDNLAGREIKETRSLTPTEKVIYDIWREALKTNEIKATDNFFDVGGNSLMAISIFSKIESSFKTDLGLRVFFDSPKIRDLAEVIDISVNKRETREPVPEKKMKYTKILKGEI